MTLRPGLGTALVLVGLAAAGLLLGIPGLRERLLRAAGEFLVQSDPAVPADIIVIATDADGAGVLEAADLVREGISKRVALFADPPDAVDQEFLRRGVPYLDAEAVSEQQLRSLGITAVQRIPRAVAGTEDEGVVLPGWCESEGLRTVLLIGNADHSHRLHRVLARAMHGHAAVVRIRASRYSQFDPDNWWRSRAGVRIEIVELQKLLLDMLRHPLTATRGNV